MRRPKSETTAAFRGEVAVWLRDLQKQTGLGIDALALRAGVGKTTLYRWLNPEGSASPSHSTLVSLSDAFGVPLPGYRTPGAAAGPDVMALAELSPPASSPPLTDTQSWWRVQDRALELAGYLPGDMVLLDEGEQPRRGDAVVADVFNFEINAHETVVRIFAPPALVTRSSDPTFADKADFVGHAAVRIRGPIVRMIRDRST